MSDKILREVEFTEKWCDFMFFCPACQCGHGIWTKKRNGLGAQWTFNGNMDAPSFQPSLKITEMMWTPPVTPENLEEWKVKPWEQKQVQKICHLFVTDGRLQYCGDCTHELAGKTVAMVPF